MSRLPGRGCGFSSKHFCKWVSISLCWRWSGKWAAVPGEGTGSHLCSALGSGRVTALPAACFLPNTQLWASVVTFLVTLSNPATRKEALVLTPWCLLLPVLVHGVCAADVARLDSRVRSSGRSCIFVVWHNAHLLMKSLSFLKEKCSGKTPWAYRNCLVGGGLVFLKKRKSQGKDSGGYSPRRQHPSSTWKPRYLLGVGVC